MTTGIVGIKRGMTRVFTTAGASVPVTVIEATPNRVIQVKSPGTDGYSAIQVTAGEVKPSRVSRPIAGHYGKASVKAGRKLWELKTSESDEINIGDALTIESFTEGQKVDVTGQSKGKGFAGVVKRHNFKTQDATHGNSLSHRAPGSIGQCQTPGRVFKGKKMAGQMGAERVTTQMLEIIKVDQENSLLLVKGAVPGAAGGDVIVMPTVKSDQSASGQSKSQDKATPSKATPSKATPSKATSSEATPSEATPSKATPSEASQSKATPSKVTKNKAGEKKAGEKKAGEKKAGEKKAGKKKAGKETPPQETSP